VNELTFITLLVVPPIEIVTFPSLPTM